MDPKAEELIAQLKDKDWRVRVGATEALVHMGTSAIPALLRALKGDWPVSDAVADVLGKIGAPAVPVLFKALKDWNEIDWHRAADALGKIGVSGQQLLSHA